MILEDTVGSIDIAYQGDYSGEPDDLPESNKLLVDANDSIILKGVKTVRLSRGSFNFSEVIRNNYIYK
jgi:hypothetical protein